MLSAALIAAALIVGVNRGYGQTIDFIRQFGSPADEIAFGVALDGTGIYVVGFTSGTLPNQQSAGARDAFLRRYDRCGNEEWTRQFGTSGEEIALGVAASGSAAYVVGFTDSTLYEPNAGGFDAFIRRYFANGTASWTHQFGGAGNDRGSAVAADATDVYVVGRSPAPLPGHQAGGGYLRKYGQGLGLEEWTELWVSGTPLGSREWVAVDSFGVYVTGLSSLTGDVVIGKNHFNGNQLWTTGFGLGIVENVGGIAVDPTGLYVVGGVDGVLPLQTTAGGKDAFVKKYVGGQVPSEVWTHQFGTSADDVAEGVAATPEGLVYVVGQTFGTFDGQTSAGLGDGFVRRYTIGGDAVWTTQFGSSRRDRVLAVAADAHSVYVVGVTEGALPGQTASGATDAFLVRLHSGPAYIAVTKSFVENLARVGRLNTGQANSLVVKLDAANEALDQGNQRVARNTVNAFANEVADLTREGVLTREDGRQLSSQIAAILATLFCG